MECSVSQAPFITAGGVQDAAGPHTPRVEPLHRTAQGGLSAQRRTPQILTQSKNSDNEDTFAWRAPGVPGAPGIQINVPAIYPNALPPDTTPSSSPGYLTPAVSETHVWAERLHHPCFSGAPNTGTKNGEKGGQLGENRGKLCPTR